jgi:hypothetical protein
MASKKKNTTTNAGNLRALRIGSRVRCTDDGVAGRIVWANAVAVKIQWDDGEQVTWKRDSLADRPIAILDPDEDGQPEAPATPAAAEVPQVGPETAVPAAAATAPAAPAPEPPAAESAPPAVEPAVAEQEAPTAGPAATEPAAPVPEPAADRAGTSTGPAQPKRQREAPAAPKAKKISALDAAAKILAEEGRPLSCKEMIRAMAAKGYWTSPGGRTPEATLYSALLRELATKGTKPASPRSTAAGSPPAPGGNTTADVAALRPRRRGLIALAASRGPNPPGGRGVGRWGRRGRPRDGARPRPGRRRYRARGARSACHSRRCRFQSGSAAIGSRSRRMTGSRPR